MTPFPAVLRLSRAPRVVADLVAVVVVVAVAVVVVVVVAVVVVLAPEPIPLRLGRAPRAAVDDEAAQCGIRHLDKKQIVFEQEGEYIE